MKESTIDQRVAALCGILESDAPKAMFDGEKIAEMFNQILSGHSAESVASKHGIELKMPNAKGQR
jgi:hypothetical protein